MIEPTETVVTVEDKESKRGHPAKDEESQTPTTNKDRLKYLYGQVCVAALVGIGVIWICFILFCIGLSLWVTRWETVVLFTLIACCEVIVWFAAKTAAVINRQEEWNNQTTCKMALIGIAHLFLLIIETIMIVFFFIFSFENPIKWFQGFSCFMWGACLLGLGKVRLHYMDNIYCQQTEFPPD